MNKILQFMLGFVLILIACEMCYRLREKFQPIEQVVQVLPVVSVETCEGEPI